MGCLLLEIEAARAFTRSDGKALFSGMMRPQKIDVNIWSDQLTLVSQAPILRWSDQMQVDKYRR